ncbi:Uncharacterized protein dnm_046290 [Desulfonema magnum]|uniref:Uncharacterized protein n=1 Tax=Desulfonema magnum TaxID=45655 RepID=A0A975BN36_9BACT|nr:Uncharacterized protein dnm_046290 [Desulfonema magnum]
MSSGETRLFPSQAADRSGKKSRVSFPDRYHSISTSAKVLYPNYNVKC